MRWVVAKIGTELLITETGERGFISTNYHVTTAGHQQMGWDTGVLTTPGLWLVRSGLIPASDWLIISLARVIIKTLATIGNNETNQSSDCESLAACVTDEPNVSISSVLRSSSHPDSAETRPSGSQWGQAGWSTRLRAQGSCRNIIAVFTFMKNCSL